MNPIRGQSLVICSLLVLNYLFGITPRCLHFIELLVLLLMLNKYMLAEIPRKCRNVPSIALLADVLLSFLLRLLLQCKNSFYSVCSKIFLSRHVVFKVKS